MAPVAIEHPPAFFEPLGSNSGCHRRAVTCKELAQIAFADPARGRNHGWSQIGIAKMLIDEAVHTVEHHFGVAAARGAIILVTCGVGEGSRHDVEHITGKNSRFVVAQGFAGMTDGTTTCLIANLPITLAAAPAYLDRHGYPRSPEELGGAAHIRHLVAERPRPIVFADGSKLMARGVFDTDSMEAMRVAALRGLGIASLPRLIIAEDLRAGRLLEIVPHASLTPVVLHMRHAFGPFLPRRAILLTEFIKNVLMSPADRA